MLKLVVCIISLSAVCCAREHLTCLRTDDTLNQQSPQTPHIALQGPPGKRGAKGQVGSRGSPGQKGEPGIPNERQMILLRDQYDSLSKEVEALRNQSRINRQLVVDVFSKGLYVPPHVYIYRLTPGLQSWQESQRFCQSWGGDLAMHGMKTLENRRKLIHNLPINNIDFWIGANDIASEGNWIWVNGESASSSELIWYFGQPSNNDHGADEDCVLVAGFPSYGKSFGLTWDDRCGRPIYALCEKQI